MCENHDYCYVQILNNGNKILKYKQTKKSERVPFVIYSDLEYLLEETNTDLNYDQNTTQIKLLQ